MMTLCSAWFWTGLFEHHFRSDTLVFAVVFVVTLFVDIVPGLASGVVLSWFLALTLPYSEVPTIHILKQRLQNVGDSTKQDDEGNTSSSVTTSLLTEHDAGRLIDAVLCPDKGFRVAIALLDLQMSLVFSNSAKLQMTVQDVLESTPPAVLILDVRYCSGMDYTGRCCSLFSLTYVYSLPCRC